MGLFYERSGGARMPGRVVGWLLICDPPQQSITEIAEALDVSKASVSTTARLLERANLIERVPVAGSRQHHYRIRSGGWPQIVQASMGTVTFVRGVAQRGLDLLADAPPERRARLQDFYDFMSFAQEDYGEAFLQRWERYRKAREKESP
jgi:DNA-binding transcriptional ArsR family regulator